MMIYAANEASNPTLGGFPTVISALAAVLVVALLAWALVAILRAGHVSTPARWLLALLAVAVPIFGPLIVGIWLYRSRVQASTL
ncbi:MAG: hypothetical protein LBE25_13625 [Arthrobacter sp.]|jgi:hypothetical protein|nr:hypothetical protein [Arthrobacter sp.]